MTIFSKKVLFVPIILVMGFIVAYLSPEYFRNWTRPSDEALTTTFVRHRDSFMKLEHLFLEDPSLRYISSRTAHHNDLVGSFSDSEPPVEYRSIFEETGIKSGSRSGAIDISFVAFPKFRNHLAGGDFSEQPIEEKGFALVLDGKTREFLGTSRTYGGVGFRQIEGRWYIYERVVVSKPE